MPTGSTGRGLTRAEQIDELEALIERLKLEDAEALERVNKKLKRLENAKKKATSETFKNLAVQWERNGKLEEVVWDKEMTRGQFERCLPGLAIAVAQKLGTMKMRAEAEKPFHIRAEYRRAREKRQREISIARERLRKLQNPNAT